MPEQRERLRLRMIRVVRVVRLDDTKLATHNPSHILEGLIAVLRPPAYPFVALG